MSIEGLDELLTKLDVLPTMLEKNIDKMKEDTKGVGIKTAQDNVPVDTGELRSSIKETKEGIEVGAKHGAPVEYGTFKMPARPFIRPAYEAMKEHVSENLGGVVDDSW